MLRRCIKLVSQAQVWSSAPTIASFYHASHAPVGGGGGLGVVRGGAVGWGTV
jgi:hypothetical protein